MEDHAPATRQDLQSVETKLETKIQSVETKLETKIESVETRLETKIQSVETRLEAKIDALEVRFDAKLEDRFERLSEQMRDMQTELLKAFLPWQEQVQIQFREIEANTSNSIAAMKERMNILERRLSQIERKLFLEPPAA